jgi:hypothetical protein
MCSIYSTIEYCIALCASFFVVVSFSLLSPSSCISCLVPPLPLFFFSMQGYSNFEDDDFDDDFRDSALSLSPKAFSLHLQCGFEEDLEKSGDHTRDFPPLRVQLCSRPPIDFSVYHLMFKQPSSQMSGSTLYSKSNPFTFPPKAPLPVNPSP